LRGVDRLLRLGPARVEPPWLVVLRSTRAGVLLARGDGDAIDDPDELIGPARRTGEQQVLALASTVAARIAMARGDRAAARSYVAEFEEATRGLVATYRATNATSAVRVCVDLGDLGLARRIGEVEVTTRLERLYADATHAMVSEMDGDTEEAASRYADVEGRWRAYGCVFEAAAAALGRGRCLRVLGRDDEAATSFADARVGFDELGARPWVARTDAASTCSEILPARGHGGGGPPRGGRAPSRRFLGDQRQGLPRPGGGDRAEHRRAGGVRGRHVRREHPDRTGVRWGRPRRCRARDRDDRHAVR